MKFAIGQGIPYQLTREDILVFLDSVFLALWYQVDGTDMVDMLGNYDPITLSVDPGTTYIPATYAGTITFPEHADLIAADAAAADGAVAYDGAGTAIGLSNANLIDADLERIPVKYDDASPHHIRMIGLLDDAVYDSLTDADKDKIARYMDLWIYFWTIDRINDGNLKENRTLGDGGNGSPVIASQIPSQNFSYTDASDSFSLVGAFSDPDGDVLTYSVTSNNEAQVTAAIVGTDVVCTNVRHDGTRGSGTATLTITASDGSLSASMNVMVGFVNSAPTIVTPVPDQNLSSGFGSQVIDLTGRYTDPDGDAVTITVYRVAEDPYVPPYNEDLSVVTASITGTDLTLTEVGAGTVHVILSASDGSLDVWDVFTVVVS